MIRKIKLTTAFMIMAALVSAQATLPTSWSFVGSPPTGWSISGTGVYTGSGYNVPAGKFDGTGDYLEIHYANSAGPLTYYLTGNSFSGGTFQVEESPDGTTWTTMRSFTNPPSSTYTLFTDNPVSTSRYIRFFYAQKVAGNIGVDEINLAEAAAGPQQEINVKSGTTTLISGATNTFSSPVGTPSNVTFTIENLGTSNTLNISSATVTGTAQADYSITTTPTSVSAASSSNLVIAFTPSVAGNRDAILTINNDDADENPYIINLAGIGGNFASEPTGSAGSVTYSNVKSYRFKVAFAPATPAPDGGYIVLRRNGTAVTDVPVDGTTYTRGDAVGNSKVAYVGSLTNFVPNNIIANTDYHFAIFPYNGSGQYINYGQSVVTNTSVTSAGNMMGTYYNGISVASPSFVADLTSLINPHSQIYYSNFGPTNVELFASRDTTGGQKVVTCVYSGYNYVYTYPFDWSFMSREHTYAHSWMPTNPASNLPEYDDQFNLFPTVYNGVNSVRSNHPFGEVVNISQQYLEGKIGTNSQGVLVYEPREEHKGDAARAVFYMATAYDGINGNDWSIPSNQDQDLLKNWHWQDLPDSWEIARNDFIDSLQGNRNPFVDSVNFVCYIDFSTMTKIATPVVPCVTATGIDEKQISVLDIHPNPAGMILNISAGENFNGKTTLIITDIAGKVIISREQDFSFATEIEISELNKGIYIVELRKDNKSARGKFVKK